MTGVAFRLAQWVWRRRVHALYARWDDLRREHPELARAVLRRAEAVEARGKARGYREVWRTATGRELTDGDFERLADEAEAGR